MVLYGLAHVFFGKMIIETTIAIMAAVGPAFATAIITGYEALKFVAKNTTDFAAKTT